MDKELYSTDFKLQLKQKDDQIDELKEAFQTIINQKDLELENLAKINANLQESFQNKQVTIIQDKERGFQEEISKMRHVMTLTE